MTLKGVALMGPILNGEVYALTAVGEQLFALRPCPADDAYVEAFAEAVREAGFDVEVIPIPIEEILKPASAAGEHSKVPPPDTTP
jgi:hypothetical protein